MIDFKLVKNVLKSDFKSLTKSRMLILDQIALLAPISMNKLIENLNGNLDRATVYRNVTIFEDLGIITKIQIGWKYKLELSEKFSSHHHHLVCQSCQKIIDLNELNEVEREINKLSLKNGFIAKSHQLEIFGLCKNCQNK